MEALAGWSAAGASADGPAGAGAFSNRLQRVDQVAVLALGLRSRLLEGVKQRLDAINAGEDQRDGLAADRPAAAKACEQGLGRVRERREPRQAEKAAGALDGVHKPEDVVENSRAVGLALEAHELAVNRLETFRRLAQKLAQQVVHTARQSVAKRVNFCCGKPANAGQRLP